MRTILIGAAMLAATAVAPACAAVEVNIDLGTQRMHVVSSTGTYDWPVSTAREGYVTPTGTFPVDHLEAMHRSKKWNNAPMPHSVFFYYGFAIHGTYETRHLGHPASHGCVRLSPANAAKLYSMVSAEGGTVNISGTPPWAGAGYSANASSPSTSGKGFFSALGF